SAGQRGFGFRYVEPVASARRAHFAERRGDGRVVAAVGFDDEARAHSVRMQYVDDGRALALPVFVERKLVIARPPRVIRRRGIEVLAEMLIEDDRLARQTVEIRRFDPVVPTASEKTGMQAIEADDQRARRDFGFRI